MGVQKGTARGAGGGIGVTARALGRDGEPTEDGRLLWAGRLGAFPSRSLTHEGRAGRAWAPVFALTNAVSEPVSSELPEPRGENQNQQTEEHLELCLAFLRMGKSPPTPVKSQASLLARRRERSPSKHLQ